MGWKNESSGIYKIINLVNNKMYIGSSKTIFARYSDHKCDLKFNRHKNYKLQNAWNKYGKENFKLEILEVCENYNNSQLFKIEQKYIDLLSPKYNLSKIARTGSGSLKHKKAVSRALSKQYILTDPNGKEIYVKNLRQFCIQNNLYQSNFNKVLNGYMKHSHKWKIRYANEKQNKYKSKILWEITTPEGKKIIIDDIVKFSEENNVSASDLYNLAHKRVKFNRKGYKCNIIYNL